MYRLVSTRAGATPFIVPHSVVTYLLFNGLFSARTLREGSLCLHNRRFFRRLTLGGGIVLIVYAKTCIDQTLLGSDLHNVIMWKSAIWFPLWFSAFSLAVRLPPCLSRRFVECSADTFRFLSFSGPQHSNLSSFQLEAFHPANSTSPSTRNASTLS